MKTYHVNLIFKEPILGTVPKDPEVYKRYIQSKAALNDEAISEELESMEILEEKGWTGFHRNGDGPIIYDYAIKGFFKDACGMLRKVSDSESSKVKSYKKTIDGLLFVGPRQVPLNLPEGEEIFIIERPLRASGPQGDRVALARSDACPKGTKMQIEITVLGGISKNLLKEWLDYGDLRGLGQWRNAGYGAFTYTLEAKQ